MLDTRSLSGLTKGGEEEMKHTAINLQKLTRNQLELLVCCSSKKIYQKPLTCCYEADSIELKERRKEALQSE